MYIDVLLLQEIQHNGTVYYSYVAEISSSSAAPTAGDKASSAAASCSPSFYYIRADRAQFPLQKFIPGKDNFEQIVHPLQQLSPQQQEQLMEQTMLRQQQQLFSNQNQQQMLEQVMPQKQYRNEVGVMQRPPSSHPVMTTITENVAAYAPPTSTDMAKQTFYFTEEFPSSHKQNSPYIQFLPDSQSLAARSHQSVAVSLSAAASSHQAFAVSLPVNASSHQPVLGNLAACTQIQYVPCYFYYPVPVPFPTATPAAAVQLPIALPPQIAATLTLEQQDHSSELSSSSSALQERVPLIPYAFLSLKEVWIEMNWGESGIN